MDEHQWIHAIQKGDKRYLEDIAEKYYDDIFRFCVFQTGSREAACDLAQETFLRFIRYVESYRHRNLKGYLLTIAMNVCRDYLRKRGMEERMTLGQADWDPYEDRSVWTTYRVYQAPDGRPYLDGSGNSFTGALGSYQESQTYTRQENGGDVKKETVEVSISIKAVPRLEGLVVRQFDGEGGQLSAEDLTLEGELPAVTWLPEAAWALVEERSPEGVVRTAYTRPGPGEEPVTHPVILLDSAGVGSVKDLTIGGQP